MPYPDITSGTSKFHLGVNTVICNHRYCATGTLQEKLWHNLPTDCQSTDDIQRTTSKTAITIPYVATGPIQGRRGQSTQNLLGNQLTTGMLMQEQRAQAANSQGVLGLTESIQAYAQGYVQTSQKEYIKEW